MRFFCTKPLKSGVYFAFTAYLNAAVDFNLKQSLFSFHRIGKLNKVNEDTQFVPDMLKNFLITESSISV